MAGKGDPQRSETTVLAEGCLLEGNLRLRGDVRIAGAVYGNVVTDADVSVESAGHVLGEVRARNVFVAGCVDGIVRAQNLLKLQKTGRVRGHVRYEELEIERGGIVNGTWTAARDLPRSFSDDEDDDEAFEAAE